MVMTNCNSIHMTAKVTNMRTAAAKMASLKDAEKHPNQKALSIWHRKAYTACGRDLIEEQKKKTGGWKMSDYTINRKLYKDIKKYDHKKMDDFLRNVYKNGYIDGKNKAAEEMADERMKDIKRVQIDKEELQKQLLTIKGVGIVKAAEVVKIVSAMLGGVDDD